MYYYVLFNLYTLAIAGIATFAAFKSPWQSHFLLILVGNGNNSIKLLLQSILLTQM